MAIRQDDPTWAALATALEKLVVEINAVNAIVADASQNLCRATEMNTYETVGVDRMWRLAMSSAAVPLTEGGQISFSQCQTDPYMYAVSYANVYLLIVWFKGTFTLDRIAAIIAQRLPEVERLTANLPRDDDPDHCAARAQLKS